MIKDFWIQHNPYQIIEIQPETIKILPNGTEIISYYWEGAEIAYIMANQPLNLTACSVQVSHLVPL